MPSRRYVPVIVLGILFILQASVILPFAAYADPNNNNNNQTKENPLFGKFEYADGGVVGSRISFDIDTASGEITNYTLICSSDNYTTIGALAIAEFEPSSIKTAGSEIKIDSDNIKMKVHDNPTGMISIHVGSSQENISFLLGEGFSVNLTTSWSENGSTFTAVLIGNETIRGVITSSNGTVDVKDTGSGTFVNVSLAKGMVKLRFSPEDSSFDQETEDAVLDGIAYNTVAGEAYAYLENGEAFFDTMEYDPDFQLAFIKMTSDELQFNLSGLDGKAVIIVIVDASDENWEGTSVVVDGNVIQEAGSIYEVIYGISARTVPLCSSLYASDASMSALATPDSSIHTVSILREANAINNEPFAIFSPLGILLEVGTIAVLVLAAVFLFRRR